MSGWMWRAPKLITGSGAATSTHARAAVAQPVDWASIPRNAVSYSPNCRYRARIRSRQDVAEQVARFVDAAQHGVHPGEDLHRDERIAAFLGQDALSTLEVDVGRVAREDLVRRPRARQTHQ